MKEYLVIDLHAQVDLATVELNALAAEGWRVVGTLHYGGLSTGAILERDKVRT